MSVFGMRRCNAKPFDQWRQHDIRSLIAQFLDVVGGCAIVCGRCVGNGDAIPVARFAGHSFVVLELRAPHEVEQCDQSDMRQSHVIEFAFRSQHKFPQFANAANARRQQAGLHRTVNRCRDVECC